MKKKVLSLCLLIESGEYKYSNWKINNKDFKRFLLKTKWNQDGVYANVVRALKHPEAPAGCVTVAIAQLMAYHRFPEYFYKNPFILNMFKNLLGKCFPIIKQWDGRYNWAFLTRKEKVEDLDSEMCELQVAVLMYHIATSCKATYAKSGTGISTEDYIKSLLNYNYLTGVCKRTYVGPPKEKPAKPVPIFEKSSDNHFCEPQLEVLHSDPSTWLFSDVSPNYYKPDGSGHKIRFSKYSFNAIKDSIDCLAPVLIEGRGLKVKSESVTSSNGKDVVDFGHAWVIDGYCNLTCDATNTKTLEKLSITADYVHCNPGWGGVSKWLLYK